ncbi:MAG: NADH-quinone oxidoreductase subunit J [Planctomycetes bacterium]|nr:NADH-quinone oxidoreductase subunit J [Planctomycetota bacterium]
MIAAALFLACCGLAIAGALGAALVRNLFHAALLLGLSLCGVAGLYLFLHAYYLACVQIVVYVGGILVLILFATLFSADVMGRLQRTPRWLLALGTVGAAVAGSTAWQLGSQVLAARPAPAAVRETPPGHDVGAIGDLLLGDWLLPFLAAGFLLTVALVGAVATVRRHQRTREVAHG